MVKGHEIVVRVTKAGYDRKSILYVNTIVQELKKLNIQRDDIEVKTNVLGNKDIPAVLEFWADGHYLRFTYSMTKRFIDNLYVIMELIKLEVNDVLTGKINLNEFYHRFTQEDNPKEINNKLKEAKSILGLGASEADIEVINKAYRNLAKSHHPDLGGDLNEFKKINKAHKLIKKEMGL